MNETIKLLKSNEENVAQNITNSDANRATLKQWVT